MYRSGSSNFNVACSSLSFKNGFLPPFSFHSSLSLLVLFISANKSLSAIHTVIFRKFFILQYALPQIKDADITRVALVINNLTGGKVTVASPLLLICFK